MFELKKLSSTKCPKIFTETQNNKENYEIVIKFRIIKANYKRVFIK